MLEDKRYVFGVKIRVFLLFVASNQCALTPAIRRYFFLPMPPKSSSCFGMISDEGGGGCNGYDVVVGSVEALGK